MRDQIERLRNSLTLHKMVAEGSPVREETKPKVSPVRDFLEKVGHHVFIGNLHFKTTQDELKKFFEATKTPSQILIAQKFNRPAGYAFATFDKKEDMEDAIEKLNGKDLQSRQLRLQPAVLKSEEEFKEGRDRKQESRSRSRSRGRGRGRGRRGGRGGRGAGRGGRGRPGASGDYEMSKTRIYLGNLPFQVTSEDLKQIFVDFDVGSPEVIRSADGRSRGFAFVEAKDEKEMQRVIAELGEITIDGRKLVYKPAAILKTENTSGGDAEVPSS